MPNTFVKIQTVTVGSGGTGTISFTSIPSTYTDLKIVTSARTNRADVKDYVSLRLNGSTVNDSCRNLSGDGTSAVSDTESVITIIATNSATATASVFGNSEFYIPNYRSSNYKSSSMDGVSENNATEARAQLAAGLWADVSPVTSIDLVPYIGTLFLEHTTATLYGIKSS